MDHLSRRAALLSLLGGVAVTSGCGTDPGPRDRIESIERWGQHSAQSGVLTIPAGVVKGLAVLVHGGGWLTGSGPQQFSWVAGAYERLGVASWNIGYRGLETGGGWPATFEDVATAMDRVPDLIQQHPRLEGVRSLALGQSAGAHLAVWAASRDARTPGGEAHWLPDSVVSLSGPLMLTRSASEGPAALARAVTTLMEGGPQSRPERYELADPAMLTPQVPIHVAHGLQDPLVPAWNATGYVATVTRSGGRADLTMIDGGHDATLDARVPGWPQIQKVLDDALGLSRPGSEPTLRR